MAYFNNCNQFFWPIFRNYFWPIWVMTKFGKCMPFEIELFFFLVISDNTFQRRTQRFHFHFFSSWDRFNCSQIWFIFSLFIMYLAEHSSKKSADWNFSQTFFLLYFLMRKQPVSVSVSRGFFEIFFLDLCGTCQLLFKVFKLFLKVFYITG